MVSQKLIATADKGVSQVRIRMMKRLTACVEIISREISWNPQIRHSKSLCSESDIETRAD